jgi:electron transport complex protein RnfG
MLPGFDNKKIAKGKAVEVDGITGATFTSDAVKENVKRALEYYWKHK